MNQEFVLAYLMAAIDKTGSPDKRARLQGRIMQQVGVASLEAFIAETARGEDSRNVLGVLLDVQFSLLFSLVFQQCRPGAEKSLTEDLITGLRREIEKAASAVQQSRSRQNA